MHLSRVHAKFLAKISLKCAQAHLERTFPPARRGGRRCAGVRPGGARTRVFGVSGALHGARTGNLRLQSPAPAPPRRSLLTVSATPGSILHVRAWRAWCGSHTMVAARGRLTECGHTPSTLHTSNERHRQRNVCIQDKMSRAHPSTSGFCRDVAALRGAGCIGHTVNGGRSSLCRWQHGISLFFRTIRDTGERAQRIVR